MTKLILEIILSFFLQPVPYQPVPEAECVVPNITVEVPNPPPEHVHCTYAPYEPERAVPPAIVSKQMIIDTFFFIPLSFASISCHFSVTLLINMPFLTQCIHILLGSLFLYPSIIPDILLVVLLSSQFGFISLNLSYFIFV